MSARRGATRDGLEHLTARANGLDLHAVAAGPVEGPLVMLLHGFPEFWYGWRGQIPRLAAAGFRVVAPDMRGCNLSDAPAGIDAYRVDRLGRDVLGWLDALGRERAGVAGHDWGGVIGWWLGAHHPERVRRLAILNAPHPAAMRAALRSDPRQVARSAYGAFFQLPYLPELLLRAGDGRLLAHALTTTSRAGTFGDEDLERYRAAWSRPGAATGMLNPYRAAVRRRVRGSAGGRVSVPTRIVWGARDRFLSRYLAATSLEACDRGRLDVLEDATHWLHHEEPERVSRLLIDAFAGA